MIIPGREKKGLIVILAAALIITGLPYLMGYILQTPDLTFGGLVMGVEDGNSYLAKMISGQNGSWLFRTPYSTAAQTGIVAYLPYILLGKLIGGDGLHIQAVNLFQFFRFCGLILYGLGLYLFLGQVVQKTYLRLAGVFLGIFGGGLGWIFLLPGLNGWYDYLPLDYYSPETFGFLSVLLYPHNAFARGLMLVGIAIFVKAELQDGTTVRWKPFFWSGMCLFAAGFFQPLNAAVGAMVYGLVLLVQMIRNRRFRIHWTAVGLGIFPGVVWAVYLGGLGLMDPFFKEWTRQNLLYSPSFLQYLIAYGVMLALMCIHFRRMRIATTQPIGMVLGLWIALLPVLAYLPTGLQRRLPEGMWCAVIGLFLMLFEGMEDKSTRKWIPTVGSISIISPLTILITIFFGLVNHAPVQYIDSDKTALYSQMESLPAGGVVISAYKTGNEIPAWTRLSVVQGLRVETIHNDQVESDVTSLFQSHTSIQERKSLINKYKVDYVFFGPDEQSIGGWAVDRDPCYQSIMQSGNYALYQVKQECKK